MTDERPAEIERRRFLQALGVSAGVAAIGANAAIASEHDGDTLPMTYELPELSYEYDALEPYVDERIMELHHSAHHQAYVDGANEALERVAEMRDEDDFEGLRAAKRDFSFHLSGHVNHTVFWENMSPDGGGEPGGALADRIDESFGSFDAFRAEFSEAANQVQPVGWAMLFYEPVADGLVIGQVESQNDLVHQDATPLLALDVWEHAYYLQYENRRDEYVEEWWNVVDWEDVAERCRAAGRRAGTH